MEVVDAFRDEKGAGTPEGGMPHTGGKAPGFRHFLGPHGVSFRFGVTEMLRLSTNVATVGL
jgi:hypothetical protein